MWYVLQKVTTFHIIISHLFFPSQITRGIHTDCLLNYETVKYFGGEEHEGERYRKAIQDYQVLEFKVMGTVAIFYF
jgi:ABC-type transport system involved in Fe-S cluster assembly fused permease/ATPase subunit